MADITASNVTNVSGSSAQTTGRNHDVWGAREVGLYRVTLTNSAPAGGFTFDPKTYGFQGVVAAVFVTKHILVGSNATMRYQFFYDFVNKKIVPADTTDAYDDATGDDLSLVILDVLVVGE
jgi:hypothetical protein